MRTRLQAALGGVLDLAAASGMELGAASDMVTDYLSRLVWKQKNQDILLICLHLRRRTRTHQRKALAKHIKLRSKPERSRSGH